MSVANEHEPAGATVPLLTPRDGVPEVVTTAAGVAAAAEALAAGSGPLAVDAERASGFRYSARAYLVQLRRAGAGTVLLDPIPTADALAPLAAAINDLEWVLHSADQDLPGLDELGLRPAVLYDTELAGRLAGFDRVGLAAIVERTLGFELRKGHGAADWSTRPLPDAWLNYAALDVEILVELRDAMAAELEQQGKSEWAAQEFEHIRRAGPPAPKPDRWRRTSRIHTLKDPRRLAIVRELWTARDELAARRDIAPGRVLPDSAIVAAAEAAPRTVDELRALPVFGGPRQRRSSRVWLGAIERARALPKSELPPVTQPFTGPPPANRWARHDPDAAARLTAARAALAELSEQVQVPVENLVGPELVRRLCWEWRVSADTDVVAYIEERFATDGARPWQRELTAPRLAKALTAD
ncbi:MULTISPECIES: ribonuclease D [Rhodococcus]|uniref:Ribonuclease D n=1 Tax=Rhodococcus aetherivorans TaxID=191292 RepID=N1MAF8_9NOCA|nr:MULTISPECIES: ribonuclease D [Rhodococcus]ANZ25382.1 3'-5' exonuclease [Rhodococcus sp. WB1]KDE13625.1 3'-5' exonuclease [Rhodococcus aetherivorans]MBC2587374.1 ribonuclease D [Rhodococcus aetherivorans]MDV6291832.1 ribonuclease D [Rhodococcus aetherivorans]OLL17630.1 ribonuclease D [Rhodococcus sp. M8]